MLRIAASIPTAERRAPSSHAAGHDLERLVELAAAMLTAASPELACRPGPHRPRATAGDRAGRAGAHELDGALELGGALDQHRGDRAGRAGDHELGALDQDRGDRAGRAGDHELGGALDQDRRRARPGPWASSAAFVLAALATTSSAARSTRTAASSAAIAPTALATIGGELDRGRGELGGDRRAGGGRDSDG